MTDISILMSAPMVRACLREIEQPGTGKTQTRRVLNPQPYPLEAKPGYWNASGSVGGRICVSDRALLDLHRKPKAGERLYVREAWRVGRRWDETPPRDLDPQSMTVFLDAGGSIANQGKPGNWQPSSWPEQGRPEWVGKHRQGMHMPRWASRLTLIVTSVKVERLQDISNEDAAAEGVERKSRKIRQIDLFGASKDERAAMYLRACRWEFVDLWDGINLARGHGWETNPWVVAIGFKPILGNIDTIKERTGQ